MESAARTVIAAFARRHGRDLAAVAYLVLDNREAAERSAAEGIAVVLRRTGSPVSLFDDGHLPAAMVGATLKRSLEAYRTTREVDPLPEGTDRALGRLSALQRAVAAGHLLAGVALEDLAVELALPPAKVAGELAAAEAAAGGRALLASQLTGHQAGVALAVAAEAVQRELAGPPPRAASRRWRGPAFALGLMLAGAAVIVQGAGGQADGEGAGLPADQRPGVATAAFNPSPEPAAATALPADERLSLADCQIQPASTGLSFRGWLPLHDLTPSADLTEAARPVYALVTSTTAEWVGWQTGEGRPMFPRPVGRLGCAVDPVTGAARVYAMADSWQAPDMVDGCPSSAALINGANREIGGPDAFVSLPVARNSWWSRDPGVEINVRIPTSAAGGSDIRAVARPLGPGEPISFEMRGLAIGSDQPPASNRYGTLWGVAFPRAGCWLLAISAGDQVIGSAVLPVSARPALRPAD